MKAKRKTIQMSEEICAWYEERAKEMGIAASNLMVMAMQQYIDQQKALSMSAGLPELLKKLEELQKANQQV